MELQFLPQVANCHESIDSTEAVRLLKNEMHATLPVFGM